MSRKGNLVKNTFILSFGTFLPKAASFITLPILTACLSKAEYGTYDLILVIASLLLPAATLQIQTAAFRFLIDVRDDEKEIKKVVTILFAFIAPTSLLTLVIFFFVLPGQAVAVRAFMCLFLFADIAEHCVREVSRGLGNVKAYSVSGVLSSLGKMLLVVVFVYCFGTGLLGTVVALFGGSFLSALYIFLRIKIYRYIDFSLVDRKKIGQMLKYSWPMVPDNLSNWVLRVSDRLVVVGFMGIKANAVYAVANKFPTLLNLAYSTFSVAWQENASIASKDEDAQEYYSSVFRNIFDLLIGSFCIITALTPVLFKLLVRGSYTSSYNHIPILTAAGAFQVLAVFIGGVFIAYKRTKSVGLTTIATAVINLVVDIALIKFIGLYAASVSTLVSYIFLFVFRIITVQKIITLRYDIRHILLGTGLMIVSCALCFQKMLVLDIVNVVFGIAVFIILNIKLIRTVFAKLKKSKGRQRLE